MTRRSRLALFAVAAAGFAALFLWGLAGLPAFGDFNGGYGRLLLGWYYLDNGEKEKAKQLFDELRKDYSEAIDHRGNLIVSMIPG